MYPLTGAICIKMQKKLIHRYQRWDHTGSIQKQTSAGIWKKYWKLSGYERIKKEDQQNCMLVRPKRDILRQTKGLQDKMGNC